MTIFKDPLLSIARAIIVFLQVVLGIGAAALVIGMPVLVLARGTLRAEFAERYGAGVAMPLPTLLGILALALVAVLLMWLFLRDLRRIIDTVGDGDPFVPVNADRLTRMAWLMLGVQAASIAVGVLALTLPEPMKRPVGSDSFNIAVSGDTISLDALVLVLVLFILARVFRLGTRMRDDLEGTV